MLTSEIKRKLKNKAKKQGISMANVIRDALLEHVEEDYNLNQKEAILEMFQNTNNYETDERPDLSSSNFRKNMGRVLNL